MVSTILATMLLGGQPYSWTNYRSAAGKYSADFPGKVVTRSQPVQTQVGSIQMYMAYVDMGPKAFMAIYNDYPTAGNSQQVLEGAWNGQTGSKSGLKVISKRTTTVSGKPAIEGEFEFNSGGSTSHTRTRLVLNGKRLYQQMVIGVGVAIDQSAADRFFRSFKLN